MTSALIVIDMQRGFFVDDQLRAQQERIVSACNELIAGARAADAIVIGVRTVHAVDRSTWTLSMLDDDQGFVIEGDADTEYINGLDVVNFHDVTKTRDSAFWQTNLLTYLRRNGIEHVVLAGVSTHLCIMQTAIDAFNANLRVTLAVDAIASCRPELHQSSIDLLHDEYRIDSASNADIRW